MNAHAMTIATVGDESRIASEYNAEVVHLFNHPQHAGSLAGMSGVITGQAGLRSQGASVRFWFEIHGQRIVAARFVAYGCPHFLAAAESLCRWAERRTESELRSWNWRELAAELDVPPAKRARLLVLEDALHRAAGMRSQNR